MVAKTVYDITVAVEQDAKRLTSTEDIKTAVCNNKFMINSMDRFVDDEWEMGASIDEKIIVIRERKLDADGNVFIIEKETPTENGMSLLNVTLQ